MDLPTVRVKHPELPGGMLINQADYDPTVHELVDGPINSREPFVGSSPTQTDGTLVVTDGVRMSPEELQKLGGSNPSMEAAITRNAARLARRDELHALKFVELKEKIADLGVAVIKPGTTKDDLVTQILNLEEKALSPAWPTHQPGDFSTLHVETEK